VRAASFLGLVAILGGCSASELVQNLGPPAATELPQPNFRRIIADNIKTIFPNQQWLGEMEISAARPVDHHLKGLAWLACLRLGNGGNPQHYAIFIQNDKILDWRAGIVIDQCHNQAYSKFEIATAVSTAKPRSQQDSGK
jgi:hypothetical protein